MKRILKKTQNGKSVLKIDRKRKALPVGKRISPSGNVYYEYRANRTDIVGKDDKKQTKKPFYIDIVNIFKDNKGNFILKKGSFSSFLYDKNTRKKYPNMSEKKDIIIIIPNENKIYISSKELKKFNKKNKNIFGFSVYDFLDFLVKKNKASKKLKDYYNRIEKRNKEIKKEWIKKKNKMSETYELKGTLYKLIKKGNQITIKGDFGTQEFLFPSLIKDQTSKSKKLKSEIIDDFLNNYKNWNKYSLKYRDFNNLYMRL